LYNSSYACHHAIFLFFLILLPPSITLFPYTTLFRSKCSLVKRLFALVLGSETLVVGRMPVLRCNNQLELFGQLVYYGNDLLTVTDRKSTRLNSSHVKISYAVFCLKKKNILVLLNT